MSAPHEPEDDRSLGRTLVPWLKRLPDGVPDTAPEIAALLTTTFAVFSITQGLKHENAHDPLNMPAWAILAYFAIPYACLAYLYGGEQRRRSLWAGVPAVAIAAGALVAWGYFPELRKWMRTEPVVLPPAAIVATLLALLAGWTSGLDRRAWGLGIGDWRWWWAPTAATVAFILVLVPIAAVLFPGLTTYYPVDEQAKTDLWAMAIREPALWVDLFVWEFFNRGYMLHAGVRHLGRTAGVLIHAGPFFMLHAHKPEPELVSAWFGGIALAYLCLRARSIVPGVIIHCTLYTWMDVIGFAF
jgi:hypothetical protein